MESAETAGDPMDWAAALPVLSEWPTLAQCFPEGIEFNPESQGISGYESLQLNSIGGPCYIYPTSSQLGCEINFENGFENGSENVWQNWASMENTMSNTYDTAFGSPTFGYISPAQSIGSGHLSIGSGSSVHSWSSWRGRSRIKKVLSRGSSIAGRAKNTMKEGISSWSLSGAKKHVSPSPRRTGKLTDATKAGIRLLKGPGACWKCKILKKSCDPGSPCKECASSNRKVWKEVGCRRGALGTNYRPVKLCPSADPPEKDSELHLSEEDWAAKQAEANRLWEEEMRSRSAEIGSIRLRIRRKSYAPHFPPEQPPHLSLKGTKLKQQVVKAMKELAPMFEDPKREREAFMLLYHAALYEESLGDRTSHNISTTISTELPDSETLASTTSSKCELIHLSIRCLNHSLDAIRSQPSSTTLHHACKPEKCGLHSIAKLQQSSFKYMNALHDVVFSKWGLSKHRCWWLAIFYSLCIQSFVRINLIKLSESAGETVRNLGQYSNAEGYLHSFISLFEAVSAEYDPIITADDDLPEREMSEVVLARIAVNPWHWEEHGVDSSYDHLRRVFGLGHEKIDECEKGIAHENEVP